MMVVSDKTLPDTLSWFFACSHGEVIARPAPPDHETTSAADQIQKVQR